MSSPLIEWPVVTASTPEPRLPLRGNKVTIFIFKNFLKLIGFKVVGELPPIKKMVVVMGPHTSNWDFVLGMLVQFAIGVRFSFIIKQSAFVPVIGTIISSLGGIPINRKAAANITQQMVDKINNSDELILVVTPEGTRSNKTTIKSGFHRIAQGAGVPVMLTKLDYKKRQLEVGEMISSDLPWEEFRTLLGESYADVKGKHGYWMDKEPDA